MQSFSEIEAQLRAHPKTWLVTGAAGFIGSHLAEQLLRFDQRVVGLDNFATGSRENLDAITRKLGDRVKNFVFIEGDIREPSVCARATKGVNIVLHEAALGSVPRSVEDPKTSHSVNVDGFVNLVLAARAAKVEKVVYASSSSVYGDDSSDVKHEDTLGKPLSPYAATKRTNEVYADAFFACYGMPLIGLRYFNVFGPRQDPKGPYAAVIPRWIENLLNDRPCEVYGDPGKSRDFCYVANVVQANLLAATVDPAVLSQRVFNVACGASTRLDELYTLIADRARQYGTTDSSEHRLVRAPARAGDIAHSLADVHSANLQLGYEPGFSVARGLDATVEWYATRLAS